MKTTCEREREKERHFSVSVKATFFFSKVFLVSVTFPFHYIVLPESSGDSSAGHLPSSYSLLHPVFFSNYYHVSMLVIKVKTQQHFTKHKTIQKTQLMGMSCHVLPNQNQGVFFEMLLCFLNCCCVSEMLLCFLKFCTVMLFCFLKCCIF